MERVIGLYACVNGSCLAASVEAVIRSGLSPFIQALVIAAVSAVIGAVGMIVAAMVSTRNYQHHIAPEVRDIKRKVEADRRESDPSGEDEE